jgi:hypothetical protein
MVLPIVPRNGASLPAPMHSSHLLAVDPPFAF